MPESTENNETSAEDTTGVDAVDETAPAAPAEEAAVAVEPADAESAVEPADADSAEEPQPQLAPKERRQRTRAARAAKAPVRKALTPEQRQAERDEERRRKAAV
jgi:hypothetical protein